MAKIAVFASGSGSNFQALADLERAGSSAYEIALLVSDQPDAYVVERAKAMGVPVFSFRARDYANKDAYETAVIEKLVEHRVDYIVLAGYMRIVGSKLLDSYEGKMINLHPSLLPAFAGKDGIGDAYNYGVKISGVTVHFVDEGLDTGAIIAQEAVIIDENDHLEDVKAKIHALEHQLLPKVVNQLVQGKVVKNGRRVFIQN